MTPPAQVAKIMSLVDRYIRIPTAERRALIEAALRDAPQAEGWVMVPVEPTQEMLDATYVGQYCSDIWRDMLSARPSAPTAVEPDERAMAHELIKVAAWLLSPEPRRKLAELEDATHIGHRQFHRAYEGTFETLRLKAIEIRNFVDAARASKGIP